MKNLISFCVFAALSLLFADRAEAVGHVVVKSGDTLSGIGSKLGFSWQELDYMNDFDDPDLIHPGEVVYFVTQRDIDEALQFINEYLEHRVTCDDEYWRVKDFRQDLIHHRIAFGTGAPGADVGLVFAHSLIWNYAMYESAEGSVF